MLCNGNGVHSVECSCKSADTDHDPFCQCQCGYCRGQRSCDCQGKTCECPMLCNCSCEHCHKQNPVCITEKCGNLIFGRGYYCSKCKAAKEEASKKRKFEAGKNDPKARKCANDGCNASAPVGGGSLYCNDCRKARRSSTRKLRKQKQKLRGDVTD